MKTVGVDNRKLIFEKLDTTLTMPKYLWNAVNQTYHGGRLDATGTTVYYQINRMFIPLTNLHRIIQRLLFSRWYQCATHNRLPEFRE